MTSPAGVLRPLLATVTRTRDIDAIGHRVVHGGSELLNTAQVMPAVRAEIERCAEFAPEHNRLELSAMVVSEQIFGTSVPQIAVFDTSFHRTLELPAKVYAIRLLRTVGLGEIDGATQQHHGHTDAIVNDLTQQRRCRRRDQQNNDQGVDKQTRS